MKRHAQQQGFSLIELMIAISLGLVISYAILRIYLTQSQFYKTSNSQSLILSAENALVNLLIPTIRDAGFLGCGTINSAMSNLNSGLPDPLGSLNTTPFMIIGYSGSGSAFSYSITNPANDTNSGDWTPILPASLVGKVQKGNDVLVVLGAMPGTYPIGVTQIDSASTSIGLQSTANTSIASGQLAAVSDCSKSLIFQITGSTSTTVSHAAGNGAMQNSSNGFAVNFQPGAQFIQMQQTAFFVGQGQGGQSALMQATLNGGTWTVQPLVPGIELMKVQYGIGSNSLIAQYVPANSVTDWSRVYSVRLGFIISGKMGSGSANTSYTVLDTTITVPSDNLLRHTFEMTIKLRNAS